MPDTVCLPQEHYIILLVVFVLLTVYYMYKMNSQDCKLDLSNILTMQSKYINDINLKTIKPPKQNIIDETQIVQNDELEKRKYLNKRDRDAIFDELKPPEKRDQEYQYPTRYVKSAINIPSRGLPDTYHALGALVRKEDEKILQLFGRQKYPGSTQWEYYVTGADTYGFPNKMPIKVKGDKEVQDKDHINVEWLNRGKGHFEVNLYPYDVPRYNPYDY
jgi:hypothetical protein